MVEHGDILSSTIGNAQCDFPALLNGLQSADNTERSTAETQYDAIPASERIVLLLQAMSSGESLPATLRALSAVLFRRLLNKELSESLQSLTPEMRTNVKTQILQAILQESDTSVRKKIADAAAEIARNAYCDDDLTWPEFVQFVISCVNSGQSQIQEVGLHMFSQVPSAFGNSKNSDFQVIKQILATTVVNQETSVRLSAVRAACAFLIANDSDNQVMHQFKDLLPALVRGLADSIAADDDSIVKVFVELAESVHKFLRPQLEQILELSLRIVANQEVSDGIRHLALEIIVTLSESCAASVRKAGNKLFSQLVHHVLLLMTDLEDEDDWSVQEGSDDEDETSNAIAGETALDRLCCGLGGKTLLPHILSAIPQMLQSPQWQYRHAALMAVSACGEGCHKQMEAMLSNILDAVLPYLGDSHPRVRYASCNAVGQMSTDFGPKLQKSFHEKVVPSLLHLFDDYENPRVQTHACAAMVNFSESCPKEILALHLGGLMGKLEQVLSAKFNELLQKGTKAVLEQVVTTLASIADAAEDHFVQFYDKFMPCLRYIMEHAVRPDLRLLRGKTIECISLIGLAVGRDKFLSDAAAVMELLLKTQTDGPSDEDDPQMTYMISAWARMCRIMGKDFEPYLPLVMGPVLRAAEIKPEVCIMDSEEVETVEQDPDWQFIKLADEQNFAIKTSGLEDKANACQMLLCYARELKESFAPYTEQVTQLMVPLLKFYFHDEVRSAACESLPYLLDCARIRGESYLAEMWKYIRPNLLKAIDTEPEAEILADGLYSLSQCIEKMGVGCLETDLEVCVDLLEKQLQSHFQKAEQRQSARHDEDYDEVEEEKLKNEGEDDEFVLSKITDVLHAIFKVYTTQFLPIFQQRLLPTLSRLLAEDRPWQDWQWGLCMFDDVIEHCGELSFSLSSVFLPRMLMAARHHETDLRQAALYGIGVMAMHGGAQYHPTLRESMPLLLQIIAMPESRSPDNSSCTDNAISAVTKVMKYCPHEVYSHPIDQLIPLWLSWLPLKDDKEEAEAVYGFLCDLLERNDRHLLGNDNCNLPRIVAVISDIFCQSFLERESATYARVRVIAGQVLAQPEVASACFQQLSPAQQSALQAALS